MSVVPAIMPEGRQAYTPINKVITIISLRLTGMIAGATNCYQ
jgi:hypothetical protein